MGGNRIPGPGQCNDGDASTDDGFEEVFSPPTLLFAGAPATLCGTKRRHSHVTAYVNTYNDPALYGATLNIYAKTQNARALIGTMTLSAVAAIAAQAQSFTPNPDTNACDGFDLELVATAGQPVLKTTGSLVAHGWEACCAESSGPQPGPTADMSECFDIRNFGGKGDYGVAAPGFETDNGPAFVKAFAAMTAAGGGYVCAPYDGQRFPNGAYDIRTPVDVNLSGVGTNGASGMNGCGSATPIVVDPHFGNGNVVFRFTGGDTSPFVVKNFVMKGTDGAGGNPLGDCFSAFQCTNQTAIFQSCVWNDLCGAVGIVYVYSCRLRMIDCTFNSNSCLEVDAVPSDYGIVALDKFIWSRFENCFWQDAPVVLQAFIRARDPSEYPNVGLSAQAIDLLGCTFGEQATHSVYCRPVTGGQRTPYVRVVECSFEMNSGTNVGAAQQPTSLNIWHAEKVSVEKSDFLWTGHPLSIAIQLVDAGDVTLTDLHTDVPGAHVDPGQFTAGAGANRIVVDATTRSLKIRECDYSYLEADCPTIEIIKNGASTTLQQSVNPDAPLGKIVVAEDSFASGVTIPAAGGTSTVGVLIEPGTAVDLDVLVLASADTQPGGSSIGPGAARLTAGGAYYEQGNQAEFSTPIATQANPTVHTDGRDTADTPFLSAGGAPPTAVLGTGSGSTSDRASLVVTNVSAVQHQFSSEIARVRHWPQWNPSMLIELFGDLLEGFYDDTSIHQDDGGLVDVWYDRSGKHNDLVQANPALRPTYNAAGNNGLPQVDFPGGGQTLVAPSMSLARGSIRQGSVLTVSSYQGVANEVLWSLTPTGALLPSGSVTLGSLVAGLGGTEQLSVVGLSDANGSPVALGFHTRMACFYYIVRDLFLDGVHFATDGADIQIAACDQLTLGDVPPGGESMTGSVQCIIVLNQAAQYDQALLDKLQAWVKARYATP